MRAVRETMERATDYGAFGARDYARARLCARETVRAVRETMERAVTTERSVRETICARDCARGARE